MLQVFHKGEGDDISFVRENVTFKVRQIKDYSSCTLWSLQIITKTF